MEQQFSRLQLEEMLRRFVDAPGYLQQSGWLRSQACGETVDSEGKPIPWLTYPALDFLSGRITAGMSVFEYGAGNSTLWWGARVDRVVSCEHDKEWYAAFRSRVTGSNTTLLLRRYKGGCPDYASEITHYVRQFDILVIDGRQRVSCANNGLGSLRDGGVILWDNSDRLEYRPGYELLALAGFSRLDFWGLGPLSTRRWCTSLFYRPNNCLRV